MRATLSGTGAAEAPQRGSYHPSFKARESKSAMQIAAAAAPFIDARPGAPQGEAPLFIEEDKLEKAVKLNPSLDSQLAGVFKQESFPEPPEAGEEDDRGYPTEDLIGGVPDPDRWKTVAMMLNNGESLTAKKVVKRPIISSSGGVLNPTLISPITGEKLGNYGSWEQDEVAAAKREEEETAAKLRAQEEEDNDTTDPLIKKLKKVLASRGAGGILGLQKRFKAMDTDGTGTLSMKEFRRGMKEMRMNLSEADMLSLFASLDPAGSGEITLTAFMVAITGYMNVRRRKLVNLAFDVLDKDGGGLVTIDDIATAYDVSKHPDFISGKRPKADILREFLDGFDVGSGGKDGKVTREEFANYYTTVSAIIHADDYFELMIRNAWHISGGTGWSANSANLRVLVTHSDGEQEVVEITNDLGLDPKDKKAVVARLRAQGVDVVAIPGYSDAKGAALALAKAAATINNTLTGGKVRPPPRLGAGPVASLRSQVQEAQQAEEHTLPLLDKLRAQVKTRGANGFIGLQRAFRIMDDDGSNFLEMAEFKKAMKQLNILLSEKQSQELFNFFDTDKSGTISLDEFIRGMQGPMSQRRQALVDMAFAILDADGSGVIDPSDLVNRYDTSKHPDVVSKRKTPEAALKEFLDSFDVGGEVDGKVTHNEFRNYYANISASIDNEDYFELMIRNAWHISGGTGAAANSANRRVLVTRADGSQAVEEIKNDLGLKADDKAGMMARLRAQGVDASKVELYGGVEDDKAGNKTLPPRVAGRAAEPPGSRRPSNNSADPQPPNYARNQPPPANARVLSSSSRPPAAPAVKVVQPTPALLIITKLKDCLKSQGVHGNISFQRKFRILDDDGDHALSLAEFKKGMRELRVELSDAELRLLFDFFDADRSGSIDFEELLQGVRDPLSQRRLDLVYQAFAILDTDGSGVIDASKLSAGYDASKHPEVIAGRMTQHEVMRSFLDTFDVGGEKDGKVTREEFVNYYTAISASIDNEDYFELMIRNAWHISGGTGAAANSANRRVLVTRADGSQAVEEIKNDLGLKADDKAGMMARLRAQGVDVSKVELYGGVDATDKNARSAPPTTVFAKVAFDEARAAELKRSALQLFNANDFGGAKARFSELLAMHYVSNGHAFPEVDKLDKSVAMCEKRLASISAQQRLSSK